MTPRRLRRFLSPVPQHPVGRLVDSAINTLQAGQPVPLDLFAALLENGVDVEELSRLHAA